MTIKELIEKLQTFDPNMPVYHLDWEGGEAEVDNVTLSEHVSAIDGSQAPIKSIYIDVVMIS